MERVSIVEGKNPIIFIAPHGHPTDDVNTSIIARAAAEYTSSYAVINNGWKRGRIYNYNNETCDCNNIHHLVDVPADEFLTPIVRFKNRIRKKHHTAFVFTIHGVSNDVCTKANDKSLSMIVGYGNGKPPSYTCLPWVKDLLIFKCQHYGWTTYEGKVGGAYSAWSRKNLCQYFKQWHKDSQVQAMQLEIIYDLRSSETKAQLCGECIGGFIEELTTYNSWELPKSFKIKQF